MELRQLEYFVAVAEEANFTRAAERVHISQSGISAQIRQLERQLGAVLIDRSGRVATLTAAGNAALGHARSALAAAEALRSSVDGINGLTRGRLVVGMLNGSVVAGLIDALATFHHTYPGVAITLTEDTTDPLCERVLTGEIDVALIATTTRRPRDVESMVVATDRIVAALPHAHPLGRRTSLTLATLENHAIVTLPAGTAVRALLDEACARAGIVLDVVLQASAPEAVAQLAIRDLGIALIPESLARHHGDQLLALPVRELRASAGLELIWRQSTNPAVSAFVETCRDVFAP